jgi:hypothetical protein
MWSARNVSMVTTTTFGAATGAAKAVEAGNNRLAVNRSTRDREKIIG